MLGVIYLASYARLIRTTAAGGVQLGPTAWALAAGGLLAGKLYRKPWAMVAGGAVAALGTVLLITGGGGKGTISRGPFVVPSGTGGMLA